MEKLYNWLMEGEPWVRYRTQIDFMGMDENDKDVEETKKQILDHPAIQKIFSELSDWPAKPLNSHRSAEHPIHKLSFLADIGLTIKDEPVKKISDKILQYQSEEGAFQVMMNIPKHFGGTGENQLAWALCDAPLTLYSLIKFGLKENPQIIKSVKFLTSLIQENGFPCRVSKELGNFRGPGKKTDPCPYANLLMLKLFSLFDEKKNTRECSISIDTQLQLWNRSQELHPYMFFAGTDFRKLKVPFIWYDLMHVLEILSHFEMIKNEKSFQEMLSLLKSKANPNLQFVPESIWKAWGDFDFGQKKIPSRWLTLMAHRILRRANGNIS